LRRSIQKNIQHVTNVRKKFLTGAAVVNNISLLRELTYRRLERDQINPAALKPSLPPVMRLFFQHFEELRFGDAVALACFDQHFSADAAITENGSNTLRNGAAVAESSMR